MTIWPRIHAGSVRLASRHALPCHVMNSRVLRPPKPKVACSSLAGRKSKESDTYKNQRHAWAGTACHGGKSAAIGALALVALLACGTSAHAQELMGPPAPGSAFVCGPWAGFTPCPRRADAPPPRMGPRLAFYGALAGADLASTEMFLGRGLEEGNPLMRHRGVRVSSRTAATVGLAMLDQHLDRKGHRRAMWAVRGVLAVGTAVIVGRNLHAYAAARRDR